MDEYGDRIEEGWRRGQPSQPSDTQGAVPAPAEPCRECQGSGLSRMYPNDREHPCPRCQYSAWITSKIADRIETDGTKSACDECDDCSQLVMCSYHSLLSELDELGRVSRAAPVPAPALDSKAVEQAARLLRVWAADRQRASGRWTLQEQAGIECAIRLESAASVPASGGWHPIATAPTDGAPFRAYGAALVHPDFNPWGQVEAVYEDDRLFGAVWDGQFDCWNSVEIGDKATHWQPFPPSPPSPAEKPVDLMAALRKSAENAGLVPPSSPEEPTR